jgi:AP2 domain
MKEIPLTQGKVALVDDADYALVAQFKWQAVHHLGERWYAKHSPRINGKKTTQLMHRLILGLEHGDPRQADHKDIVNTLDNRRANLRATLTQNQHNKGKPKNNTSGFKGIVWCPPNKAWQVRIGVKGKRIFRGYFPTPELAARAYDAAAIEYHGEFAVTNASLGLLGESL